MRVSCLPSSVQSTLFSFNCCFTAPSIALERLPFIDPRWPHLSQRHQTSVAQRTAIERIHKLMKFDSGDARLGVQRGRQEEVAVEPHPLDAAPGSRLSLPNLGPAAIECGGALLRP